MDKNFLKCQNIFLMLAISCLRYAVDIKLSETRFLDLKNKNLIKFKLSQCQIFHSYDTHYEKIQQNACFLCLIERNVTWAQPITVTHFFKLITCTKILGTKSLGV